ncbi:MAG: hypothetical protein ACI8PT_004920 [Gammaproteobacteria bacterium]|jgi:hypothetical protein
MGSPGSTINAVTPVGEHGRVNEHSQLPTDTQTARSHPLAAAIDRTFPGPASRAFRAIVIGDGDFSSNSLFPFYVQ